MPSFDVKTKDFYIDDALLLMDFWEWYYEGTEVPPYVAEVVDCLCQHLDRMKAKCIDITGPSCFHRVYTTPYDRYDTAYDSGQIVAIRLADLMPPMLGALVMPPIVVEKDKSVKLDGIDWKVLLLTYFEEQDWSLPVKQSEKSEDTEHTEDTEDTEDTEEAKNYECECCSCSWTGNYDRCHYDGFDFCCPKCDNYVIEVK